MSLPDCREIFDVVDEAIFIEDADNGKFIYVNDALVKMYGYASREEALTLDICAISAPRAPFNCVNAARCIEKAVALGNRVFEWLARKKNGEVFWTEMSLKKVALGGRNVTIAVIRDITVRKEAEKKQYENIEKHRILLDASPDPIFSFTPEGRYIYVNGAFASGVGMTVEQIIGNRIWDVFSQDEADKRFSALSTVFKTGEPKVIEVRVPRPGRDFYYITTITPIKDDKGDVVIAICSSKDITERKESEERIKTLLQEKELLLMEVHHRVKNNMNTIFGFLFLQSRMQKNPEARAALQDAQSRVTSMGLLYDKLYRSPRYESISVKEYLTTLIREICNIFPEGKSVKLNICIEDFVLNVNKLFPLGIIINEVITNSMKYAFSDMAKGTIDISLAREGETVKLTVADNGPGLPEAAGHGHAKGFGFQLISTLADQIGGTFNFEIGGGARFVLKFKM